MKKVILFSVFFSVCIMQVPSQEYRPMLQVGKVWHMNWPNMSWSDGSHDGKWDLIVEKDTVVGGEKCFKVLSQMSFRTEEEGGFILKEDEGKVWLLDSRYPSGKKLLYDFTLSLGDAVAVSEGSDMTVESIDTIDVHGEQYRRFTMLRPMSEYYEEERQLWVEGIGSIWGPVIPLRQQGVMGFEITLDSCTIGESLVFSFGDFEAPAVVAAVCSPDMTTVSDCNVTSPYCDLQGRCINTPSRRGLYIRGGRKVIVKF